MKTFLLWLWMLTKRLYKKPLFPILLLALPLTTLLYREAAKTPGGAVTVALTQEADDPLATQLIESLPGSSQLVRWLPCDGEEAGLSLLRSGKADALWVFPAGLQKKIAAFTEDPEGSGGFITVYERQDSVALMLCRERLSSLVYPQIARQVYLNYLRQSFSDLEQLTDEQLLAYYDATVFDENLFTFDSGGVSGKAPGLLLSPLRGLLAVLTQLCALAAAMYYLEDRKKGTFGWVRRPWKWAPEAACQLVSVLQVALVSGVCLALCGLAHGIFREVALTGLYGLCCCGFAMTLRRLVPRLGILAVLTPLLCISMLVICPVFFEVRMLRPFQGIFPMGWYLRGDLTGLGLYTAGCFSIAALLELRTEN